MIDMGLPPSPCSLFGNNLFKRYSVLHTSRALQQLVGPNDPKLNMKMAESLLTISAQNFLHKWNFDPIKMKPTNGKFVWTPVRPEKLITTNDDSLLSSRPVCSRLCQDSSEVKESQSKTAQEISIVDRLTSSDLVGSLHTSVGQESICLSSRPVDSKLEVHKTRKTYQKSTSKRILSRRMKPTISKTRQCKITEFGRQRKRLNSTSHLDSDIEASPRKKVSLVESPLKG